MSVPAAQRRHIVLGANGFIGRHVLARLARDGRTVLGVVRDSAAAQELGERGFACAVADVRVPASMREIIEPDDVVFHLAGRSGAAESFDDPLASLHDNCNAMLAVLEACVRLERVPRIVFAGSRLQYGRVAVLPVPEDAPLVPTSPYGLHKTMCEAYLDLYARRFGIGYAVARLTNPYGSSEGVRGRSYNVLDQIVRKALAGQTVTIFGDGAQIRDYVHIDDTVDALLLLADRRENIVANVGSGTGIAFRDAVACIVERAGGSLEHVPWPERERAVETGDFVASIERARSLGYEPRVAFASGIERSIATAIA